MGYISVEWGIIKILIIIFSLIFMFIGVYPFLLNILEIFKIEDNILHILLIIIGFIQLFLLGIKSKRPKID